jgi:hypothetical protein
MSKALAIAALLGILAQPNDEELLGLPWKQFDHLTPTQRAVSHFH